MERVNVDPENGQVDIDGVAIPFYTHPGFTAPEFKKALDYWPHYQAYAQRLRKIPYTPSEYLEALCLVLGTAEVRNRTAERWKERVLEHFSVEYVASYYAQRGTLTRNDIFPAPKVVT